MKRLCVFCGSALGVRAEYGEATRAVAAELAHRRLGLVYGGGSAGLMGVLADTELRLVDSMHERKATMAVLVDGFVALPGGLGTLEETLEILTWSQLGIHRKPVGILNTAGYYDSLLLPRPLALRRHAFRAPRPPALLATSGHPARLAVAVADVTAPRSTAGSGVGVRRPRARGALIPWT